MHGLLHEDGELYCVDSYTVHEDALRHDRHRRMLRQEHESTGHAPHLVYRVFGMNNNEEE